ncbi:DinB family protein [Paenibacillus gansuensis]|uniref:DinB family protein n=1 Tax=Paenibacillus gansuensis TaxID=306542 RepID=A0ABW5PMK7_9BACL
MSRAIVEMLERQFKTNWSEESWAPPLQKALDGVTSVQAAWVPPGGGNSIWQILNHLNYYNERTLRRLNGEEPSSSMDTNTGTFGDPGNPADEAGWAEAVQRAHRLAERFLASFAELTDADLDKPFGDTTIGREIPLWILHDGHHTGQIVLLRKQQGSWPATRESFG